MFPAILLINPSVTTRDKISQNVDTLVYLVHLKSRTLSILTCSKYIYRSKCVNRFGLVKALSGIVQGVQNDSKNQSKITIWVNMQNRQLTDFDHHSYIPQKFSYSRRDTGMIPM